LGQVYAVGDDVQALGVGAPGDAGVSNPATDEVGVVLRVLGDERGVGEVVRQRLVHLWGQLDPGEHDVVDVGQGVLDGGLRVVHDPVVEVVDEGLDVEAAGAVLQVPPGSGGDHALLAGAKGLG